MLEKAEFIAPLSKDFNALFSQFSSANSGTSVETINSSVAMKTAEASPVAVATVNPIAVSRSDLAVFDGLRAEARRFVNAGRPQEAVDLLVPRLTQYSTDGEFVELLHQAYLGSGQTSEAINLRSTTRGVLPKHYTAKMQASELLQSGKPSEAIPVLERDLPSYEQDKGYYGLLAGLYYKVQRFSDAERAYEKLLGVAPTSGSYWLGYAVALDAQQDKRALPAFKKAQILLPESDASKQYVERRVRELGGK
jgi:MSHA biogenesis protein MshN